MSFASKSNFRTKSELFSRNDPESFIYRGCTRAHDHEAQGLYSSPIGYYDFLQNRVLIRFKPKFEDSGDKEEFELVLSKKMNYETVRAVRSPLFCSTTHRFGRLLLD